MPDPVSSAADSPTPLQQTDPVSSAITAGPEEYMGTGIPASAVVRQAPPPESEMDRPVSPYILLITDDRVFGEHVTHALERLHYRTTMIYTSDPAVAISRCASERPALAMLNVDSLSLGGISLSRRLKADTPDLKVLSLVHGHELEAAQREAEVSGSDAVCALLDLPLQLEAIVRELLERRIEEKEIAPPEPVMTLQDKIRAEASVFDFSALLDGVRNEPEAAAESPIAEEPAPSPIVAHAWPAVERRAFPRRRGRRPLKPLIFATLGLAAVALPIYLLNSGVLQSDTGVGAGPAVPLKPDVNLTARKGLPFPSITPGERIATERLEGPISEEVMKSVFQAYEISPADSRGYVVIRLIPAQLGGTENLANLFPTTRWFADLKSRLDRRLVELVKTGQLTIEQAETDLKDNWVRASHRYYIRNYGINDPAKARQKEEELNW